MSKINNLQQHKISRINFFSNAFKNKKYKLLRKTLPYLVVTPLFLGIMHFGSGISIDHGNIIEKYTYVSDEPVPDYMNGYDKLTYKGKWEKTDKGYSRVVNVYNSEPYDEQFIHNILVQEDCRLDFFENHTSKDSVETTDNLFFEEKLFNTSIIEHVRYDKNKMYYYGKVGPSRLVYPLMAYFIFQAGAIVIYKNNLESYLFDRKSKKIVELKKYRKRVK